MLYVVLCCIYCVAVIFVSVGIEFTRHNYNSPSHPLQRPSTSSNLSPQTAQC